MRGDKTSRGSPTPGPTGSTWALERSDERRAQQGAPSLKPVGTTPKPVFWQVSPTARYVLTL